MFGQTTHTKSKALLFGAISCIAVLGISCRNASQPTSSPTASAPSAPASTGGGDFEGTIAMKVETENQGRMEMTYFLKGPHTRIETKVPDVPEGAAVMLWDLEGSKIITLMPARKMYMTMDLKETAEAMKESDKEMKKSHADEEEKFPKLTPTGKQETIAGYTCEHWLMGDKQELDMCVAKGLGYFGMGGQARGGADSWKNLAFSPKMLAEAANHPDWVKLLEGGAFPLKFTAKQDGKVTINMEATKIERKSLDDSLFVVPADYKAMNIPTQPGLPAGKQ